MKCSLCTKDRAVCFSCCTWTAVQLWRQCNGSGIRTRHLHCLLVEEPYELMVWGNWSSELKPDQRFFDWCPLVLEEQKATSHGTCSEIVSWFDCQDWVWWSRANSRNLQWSQWSTSGCSFDVFVLLCEVWMFWGETFWSGSMCLWN